MPQRFTAWSKSDRVQLAWLTQELDLTQIRILRATSSLGPFTQIDSVAANVSTYQYLGLTANTYYYYRIQSLDATGLTSPLAIDEGRRVSHQAGIYIVDATRNGAGGPGDPSDAQVDAFYESLLAGFRSSIAMTGRPSTTPGATSSPMPISVAFAPSYSTPTGRTAPSRPTRPSCVSSLIPAASSGLEAGSFADPSVAPHSIRPASSRRASWRPSSRSIRSAPPRRPRST